MQNDFLINGGFEECLTPLDRGFAYGDGVFRTIRVSEAIPVDWDRHYRKLHGDCAALGIDCPVPDLFLADIERLCNQDADVVIKIVVTRGESARGYAFPLSVQPNRILIKSVLPAYPPQYFSEGVRLHLCQLRLALQPRLAGIKHLNRLENVLARSEWSDPHIADGLLLDMAGNVIECTMSNLFVRTGNRLATPDLSQCGVAGVTREHILESAPQLGCQATVGTFGLNELLQADEVIICNSLYGVWQVRHLGDKTWSAGTLAEQLRAMLPK